MQRWNVLATSVEGRRDFAMRGLRRLGVFRGGGYRNVCIGLVESVPAFLDAVDEAVAADALFAGALARVLPVEEVVDLDPAAPLVTLEPVVRALAPRCAGGSFFVRLERRGLKGLLHSSEVERALGGVVWQAIEALGGVPRVDFRDADHVVCIETLGTRAGVGLIDRALRAAHPLVHVR